MYSKVIKAILWYIYSCIIQIKSSQIKMNLTVKVNFLLPVFYYWAVGKVMMQFSIFYAKMS